MFLPVRGVPGGKAASASRRERTHAVPTELATRETDAKSSRRWTCRCWPKAGGRPTEAPKRAAVSFRRSVFLCLSCFPLAV